MESGKRKQSRLEYEKMLNNEDFVVEQVKKVPQYKEEVDHLVSLRKPAGVAAREESDSDMAHDDDSDVEDDAVAAQHHKDKNAAQQSVASKRSKIDTCNVIEGKRDRKPTTAPRAAVYANRSELAFQSNPVHPIVCGMRISLRKGWCKTPDEVALDKKLEALIHAIELMYTWDQRVEDKAEQVRREAASWFPNSPHAHEDPVWVTFSLEKFLANIVHESAHAYVVRMPPLGDDNMPIELRSKIEAACPGRIGPFDSRNESDTGSSDHEDLLGIDDDGSFLFPSKSGHRYDGSRCLDSDDLYRGKVNNSPFNAFEL